MTAATGRGVSNLRQPKDMNEVVEIRDGVEVTLVDRVSETLRLGGFLGDAAARAGVDIETLRLWRKDGARISRDLLTGRKTRSKLRAYEERCVQFDHACNLAEAEARVMGLTLAHRLMRGGYERRTTRTKQEANKDGELVETEVVETTEVAEPDGAMLRWWLSSRWPNDFSGRVELSGPRREDGTPGPIVISNPTTDLLEELERMAQSAQRFDGLPSPSE